MDKLQEIRNYATSLSLKHTKDELENLYMRLKEVK